MRKLVKNIRGKGGGGKSQAGGSVYLVPPPAGTELFQSISFESAIDLISEGPIEGIVTKDGSLVNGIDLFEGIYYNNTPVKEPKSRSFITEKLKFNNIQLVGRVSVTGIESGLQNIRNSFQSGISSTFDSDNSDNFTRGISKVNQFEDPYLETLGKLDSIYPNFGYIQFHLSGIFDAGSTFTGAINSQFTFRDFYGDAYYKRYVELRDGSYSNTPKSYIFGEPKYNDNLYISGSLTNLIGHYTRQSATSWGSGIFSVTESGSDNWHLFSGGSEIFKATDYSSPFLIGSDWSGINGTIGLGETLFSERSHFSDRLEGRGFEGLRADEMFGGGILFFNMGNNDLSDTGKFLVNYDDADLSAKIQSGIDNHYDVFCISGNDVSLAAPISNQVCPALGEIIGEPIKVGGLSDFDDRFNYTNARAEFRKGEEDQVKMINYSSGQRTYQVDRAIYGPFVSSTMGNAQNGSGNSDYRDEAGAGVQGDFAEWQLNLPQERDEYFYTHIITQNEVSKAIPTIQINALKDTDSFGENEVGRDLPEFVDVIVERGFEGEGFPAVYYSNDEERVAASLGLGMSLKSIFLAGKKESETFNFQGIVSSPYRTELEAADLPQMKILKNVTVNDIDGITPALISSFGLDANEVIFEGDSWQKVNRYIRVRKKTFETESILISRDIDLSYITEFIDCSFTYPYSAIVGTTVDARTFATIPSRTFDTRLKKVLIPSNYCPLGANGEDRRFVDNASTYGLRDIQTFNGSTYVKVADKIDLGEENYEISFKVKLGSFNTSTTPVYFIDVDGGNFNTPGRVAVYHRDNGGGSSPEIGMVGKDDAGNTDFSNKDISISAYSSSDVFTVSLKAVGSQYTLTVKVGETLVGTQTGTLTNRPSFSYDPRAGTNLLIGSGTTHASSSFLDNGTQIADFKIKKNNQLLHHWDGTIIDTTRLGECFKDRFGGNHGEIIGTANAIEDTSFEFGRNKEQIYIGDWDGSFKLAWTDNPAWVLYDLMINSVYGIGSHLDDLEDIDIFSLFEIARYCDGVDEDGYFDGVADSLGGLEPRFSCNILLSEEVNAFEVLGNIASIFRGISFWAGGTFHFSSDRPKQTTAIFNNGNVFDGIFNYSSVASQARFTRVEVPYADKNDNYILKKEYVEDEEGIRNFGLITNEQNGIGSTSKSQARRLGKYILLSNKLETELVTFSAGLEGLTLFPGDIFMVQDELKNFEINYGKILDLNTGSNPYVSIESCVNTGSVLTGQNGGLYLYNQADQVEIKNLYKISKFEQENIFGDDDDIYSGKIPIDQIEKTHQEQVSRFNVTGFEAGLNFNKLLLDPNQDGYEFITGVSIGSTFNVKLNNQIEDLYKVVSIKEVENNLYEIQGLQYELDKFETIESQDLDLQPSSSGYNIGIPQNTVNTPAGATLANTGIAENNIGKFDFTGVINQINDTPLPTKYRVSLIKPNGQYQTKEFLREGMATDFEIKNLDTVGNYEAVVTSLLNPESKESFGGSFFVGGSNKVRPNLTFDKIEVSPYVSGFQENKTGLYEILDKDLNLNFKIKNCCDKFMDFNSYEMPYVNVYVDDVLIKPRWRSENCQSQFSQLRDFELKFELFDRNDILQDSYNIACVNPEPVINSVSKKDFNNGLENLIKFKLNTSKDVKKVVVFTEESGSLNEIKEVEFFESSNELNIKILPIDLEFENGNYDFKFLPYDELGSGMYSSSITAEINQKEGLNEEDSETSLIKTIYMANGSGNQIIESSNNESGLFLETGKQYSIDFNFNGSGEPSGAYRVELLGNKQPLIEVEGPTSDWVYNSKKVFLSFDEGRNCYFNINASGVDVNYFSMQLDQL